MQKWENVKTLAILGDFSTAMLAMSLLSFHREKGANKDYKLCCKRKSDTTMSKNKTLPETKNATDSVSLMREWQSTTARNSPRRPSVRTVSARSLLTVV